MIERLARWLDRRIGGQEFAHKMLTKVFPESWTFLFGEIALYAFIVLVATGTFLALFFVPSTAETTYHGSYAPLRGVEMTLAYESVLDLSFEVRAGLLMRQMHHWAANIFVAAIVVHLARVFFTGAFRRPREINWGIGVTLLLLAILEGFAGYSLLDDLLSGVGLRIGFSVVESIPLVGTWIATAVFGGLFPGEQIINRLFTVHVFVIPVLLFALIGAHLALIVRQTHTQFPGPGRREDNVVGAPIWPTYTALSVGLFLVVAGVIAGLGGLVQINPVWFWGPYSPFLVTIGAQPDWYMGWLEGSLRLFPPWEFTGFGVMVPNPFFPAVLLPGLTFVALYAWPYLERTVTGDRAEHHLLDRPRDRPARTAIGVGTLTFYALLTIAGSQDILAFQLQLPITALVYFLRAAVLVLPLVTAAVAYRWCRDLQSLRPAGAGATTDVVEEAGGDGTSRPRRRRRGHWGLTLAGIVGAGAYWRWRRAQSDRNVWR